MFPFRKREPKPPPTWLKWAMIGFLIYALLMGLHKGTPGNSNPLQALAGGSFNLDDYKNKLFPGYQSQMRMKDMSSGEGAPAVCGQTVKIAYDAFLPGDKPVGDSASVGEPLEFKIGGHAVVPALEQGVLGMKKGARRSLIAPSAMAYGATGFSRKDVPTDSAVKFNFTLLELSPALPDFASVPYRVADTILGQGAAVACGEKAKAMFTVWSLEGKKLFENKEPLAFTPGDGKLPLGIELGVLGMHANGLRTIILPPVLQKTMGGGATETNFSFPSHQTVLVDVEVVP